MNEHQTSGHKLNAVQQISDLREREKKMKEIKRLAREKRCNTR